MTDIRSIGLIEAFLAPRFAPQNSQSKTDNAQEKRPARTDLVTISRDLVEQARTASDSKGQTRLVSETLEQTETGFRRVQEFERGDGEVFTRTESFTITEQGFARQVSQENPTGINTVLEELVERRDNGTVSRIQRFTDESGQTTVRVEDNFSGEQGFVLPDGNRFEPTRSPFDPTRGTQIDERI